MYKSVLHTHKVYNKHPSVSLYFYIQQIIKHHK